MVCIYWITYDVLDTERLIRQTLVLWVGIHTLLSAAGLAGIGLYFLNVVTEVARIRPSLLQLIPFPRTEGFSAGPNAFILDVHWAMTAALIFWMEAKQKGGRALWVWAAFWILFFAMMGTVSRAILGSLVSLLLLLNQHHKAFRLTVWKQIVAGLLILITPIVLILTVWVITPFHLQNPILHSSHRLISDWNDAWSPYFLMAVVNIDMIKDHWLWGIGLGHFQHWLPVYSAAYPMDEYSIYETRSSFNTLNPMSFYLGWFVQTGLPGLAALAAFFIPFFLRLLRAKEGRLLALGFYAAMAGFFIQGLFTDYMFSRGFWLFLGLAAAVIKVPQEMNGASGRRETKLCR